MPKQTALKLHVEIGANRTVQLPNEVPAGPAELIVVFPDRGTDDSAALSPIGLFQDEPALIDEVMEYGRATRSESRMRDLP